MATELGDDLVSLNDFETGGLNERVDNIIGYGSVIVDPFTLTEIRATEILVKPISEPSAQACAVNGYTPEKWQHALHQGPGIIKYREFLGGVKQFASWNPWFDRRFLVAAQELTSVTIPLDYHTIDLVAMFREAMWRRGVRLEKFSLDHALRELGLEPEPVPHLPLQGARKALEVWRKLREL